MLLLFCFIYYLSSDIEWIYIGYLVENSNILEKHCDSRLYSFCLLRENRIFLTGEESVILPSKREICFKMSQKWNCLIHIWDQRTHLGLLGVFRTLLFYYYSKRKHTDMTLPNFFNLKFKVQKLELILIGLLTFQTQM